MSEHQHELVDTLVQTGRYQNASEVLREGLRLVQQRERTYTARLEALRDAVAVGVADIEAGRYETFDDPAALESWVMALGESN